LTARPTDVHEPRDVPVPVAQGPDIVETSVQAAATQTVPETREPAPRPTAPRPSKKGAAARPTVPAPVEKGPAAAVEKPTSPPPPPPVTAKPEEPVRSPAKMPPPRVSPDTLKPARPRDRTTLEGRTGGAFDELEEMERGTR